MMRYLASLIFLVVLASSLRAQGPDPVPIFAFGLLADVQYADAERAGKRDYRGSLPKLERTIEIFNRHDLRFIIHAGDLIDRDYASFEPPMRIFRKSKVPVHYVIGNHEFAVADSLKGRIRSLLNNPRGYYTLVEGGIQFVLIDAMEISLMASPEGSNAYRTALKYQQELKQRNANNAYEWNGAVGPKQLRWLKRALQHGEQRGYRSIIFSHHPFLPENGLQAWNNREVVELLRKYPSVIACISGHHHEGGYVKDAGIHYLTLKGLVEATSESSGAIAEVFPDKIIIRGFGDQTDHILDFR